MDHGIEDTCTATHQKWNFPCPVNFYQKHVLICDLNFIELHVSCAGFIDTVCPSKMFLCFRPLTEEELQKRREAARQRHAARMEQRENTESGETTQSEYESSLPGKYIFVLIQNVYPYKCLYL